MGSSERGLKGYVENERLPIGLPTDVNIFLNKLSSLSPLQLGNNDRLLNGCHLPPLTSSPGQNIVAFYCSDRSEKSDSESVANLLKVLELVHGTEDSDPHLSPP